MNTKERDELLIRIDERQQNILSLTVAQEKHLRTLNSKVAANVLNIDRNDKRLARVESFIESGIPYKIKLTKKQMMAGGGTVIPLTTMVLYGLGHLVGWW